MRRFRAALARSAPENLALSIPYYSEAIVDTLTPHASRLSSFNVGPTLLLDREQVAHPKLQRLLCVSHPPCVELDMWCTSPLTFSFTLFTKLRSLQLQHTHFHAPVVPYLSLCHLRLDHCAVRPSPTSPHVHALCAIHNTLEFFPSLETLSLTCCLPDKDPADVNDALPAPDLSKSVHLPRLRHLELTDLCDHMHRFLSHLVFPPTTALALQPTTTLALQPEFDEPATLIAGLGDPVPALHAELHLEIQASSDSCEESVHWETHGGGVRPVHVQLPSLTTSPAIIVHFTRELVAALAPARGVTTVTAVGAVNIYRYWDELWPEVGPQLRRLVCAEQDPKELVSQLERERFDIGLLGAVDAGTFACPVLEVLALEWHLPPRLDYGLDGDWRVLRDRDDGRYLARCGRAAAVVARVLRHAQSVPLRAGGGGVQPASQAGGQGVPDQGGLRYSGPGDPSCFARVADRFGGGADARQVGQSG
uniref:Cytochrome P450 monooxygenase CYP52X1 n=1 Tax=Ganoderma boninense TaxID=34458 RepID=A0A5K1K131_9APHY|nr:Cytochrome P450 monooxygenase CYP52X1 [Ganoderma boninense]